jgi:aryl-alcohol dehydrogenase-like predicted oxidoreductase
MPTVAELADSFMADHVTAKRKGRTAEFYRDILDRIVKPAVGTSKADKPTRGQVGRLHSSLVDTASKIRFWGVSNFSVRQMDDLFRIPQGDRCATNHVPYSIGDRAMERDLLPWCEQHGIVFLVIGLRRAYLSATLSNHGSAR